MASRRWDSLLLKNADEEQTAPSVQLENQLLSNKLDEARQRCEILTKQLGLAERAVEELDRLSAARAAGNCSSLSPSRGDPLASRVLDQLAKLREMEQEVARIGYQHESRENELLELRAQNKEFLEVAQTVKQNYLRHADNCKAEIEALRSELDGSKVENLRAAEVIRSLRSQNESLTKLLSSTEHAAQEAQTDAAQQRAEVRHTSHVATMEAKESAAVIAQLRTTIAEMEADRERARALSDQRIQRLSEENARAVVQHERDQAIIAHLDEQCVRYERRLEENAARIAALETRLAIRPTLPPPAFLRRPAWL
eukprot:gnl/Spiro4/4023_TR2007_c0_g1_i1.p1 gnl/Spiro4/4023_TR2007_c0_g1~~gnl/Spiro4/4023_TR2007_c0_g1_i1.p1  ORF type:complete len:327 (+),score=83.93 gnl/Spiro4/4023_TR2007_c0_g1_i1:46-981(+)